MPARAAAITVRGLGRDFTRVRLNQLEALATTGGTDSSGGAHQPQPRLRFQRLRLGAVQPADRAQERVGGSGRRLARRDRRPADRRGRSTIAGFSCRRAAQAGYNDSGDEIHPRGAGLITNTFADGRLRRACSPVAYNARKAIEDGYSDTSQSDYSDMLNGFCTPVPNTLTPFVNPASGTGNRPNGQCFSNVGSNAAAYNAVDVPDIFPAAQSGHRPVRERPGEARHRGRAAVAAGGHDRRLTLDLVYSELDQDRKDYALSNASSEPQRQRRHGHVPELRRTRRFAGSRMCASATAGAAGLHAARQRRHRARPVDQRIDTDAYLAGLTLEHEFDDHARGTFDASKTGSEFDEPTNDLISYDRSTPTVRMGGARQPEAAVHRLQLRRQASTASVTVRHRGRTPTSASTRTP